MELMSALLLCSLATFLPQAPGQARRRIASYGNGYNESLIITKKMSKTGKNIILNRSSPSLLKFNDLQSTFMDPACKGCYVCIERAMKSQKLRTHMKYPRISSENFQDIQNVIDINRRDKRKVKLESTRVKKNKTIKPKKNKNLTLMKYEDDGNIYALKIKETSSILNLHNKSEMVTTCQVYSVRKSFSCESPEANLVLTESRKKTNKKGKKGHGKRDTKILDPIKTVIVPVYRKRNMDDSQVPEQIMPSIEELY